MHRFSATTLVVVIVASLLVPLAISQAFHQGHFSALEDGRSADGIVATKSLEFSSQIDTSATVPEYPLLSRALMLRGGSVDVVLGDVNKDGIADLVVAVGGDDPAISIFEGRSSGDFLSYASYNISLDRIPVSISLLDAEGTDELQIAVLERRMTDLEVDRLEIFDYNTSTSSFEAFLNEPRYISYENATMIVSGSFSGDDRDDVAAVCGGGSPHEDPGFVELFLGPNYLSPLVFETGIGASAICSGDFDTDGDLDLAISNYYDSSVMIFYQPFTLGMSPNLVAEVDGFPESVNSGKLNNDGAQDLAVVTSEPSAIHFFIQNLGQIPTSEDYNRTLDVIPSDISIGDLNGDGRDDILIISMDANVALGMLQRATYPPWGSAPDFEFPTGLMPRNSLISDLDGDSVADIAVASARHDWNGSSIALYTSSSPNFSNSNITVPTYPNYPASSISVGDINGDDWDDLIALYPAPLNAFGYCLSFSGAMTTMALGYEPGLMLVADLDGDGYSDVMTTNHSSNDFTVRFGASTLPASFEVKKFECQADPTSASIGDLNGDGLLDIVFSTDAGGIEVFFNTGDGEVFGPPAVLSASPGMSIASVTIGDFNSDGLDDIAFAKGLRTIGVILQDGYSSTPISLPVDINLTASFDDVFDKVLSGDINGDRKDDIIGIRDGDNKLYLYDQEEFAGGVPVGFLSLPESPVFVSLLDATDDGFVDLMAIFGSADLAFLYKQEGGMLPTSPSMTFVTGASPCWALLGDATQDHRGDLIVCNSESHSISAWEQVNFPPVADAGGPYIAHQGDPFTFNGSSDTGISEAPYMEYRWDFDDDGVWDTEWAREPNPVFTYLTLGEFNVTMEVRDPLLLNDTDRTTVNVVDSYPHPGFTIDPDPPVEGVTVYFNDTTTSYDAVVMMNWSVDEVLVESGEYVGSITAVFDDGLHSVSLAVTDSDGSVANRTEVFEVLAIAPQVFIDSPATADEGSIVLLEAVVDSHIGGSWDPIVSYEWNFSFAGEPFVADEVMTVNTTTHVFYAEGDSAVYTVAVRVTDSDGNSSIAVADITIFDIGPDATVSLSTSTPGEGVPFSFIAHDSPDGVSSWSWTLTGPEALHETYYLTAEDMSAVEFSLANGSYHMTLVMIEDDGDSDEHTLDFAVAELPPEIALSVLPSQPWYYEFEGITLMAAVESYDPTVLYEWDFAASGGEFLPDSSTTSGSTPYSYLWTGNYTAKVRVTDSDGSSSIGFVTVEIHDSELEGSFDEIAVARVDPLASSTLTFNASYFADAYPDISNVLWEFGDGSELLRTGPPSTPISHAFDPVSNYQVNITMTDDDGNVLRVSRLLPLIQPVIELISPHDGAVVVSGTSLRFSVSDDTIPLEFVRYAVNDAAPVNFTTLYEIDTSDWADGAYVIDVMAKDRDGNLAVLSGLQIGIDNVSPQVSLYMAPDTVFAGDRLNVTITVDDDNVDPDSVVMLIRFPGDDAPLSVFMKPMDGGRYYSTVEIPMRTGTITFWFEVEDLAGNSVTSESYSVTVKMYFIDAAWPYILLLTIVSALGMTAYFVRESKIAIDETFVIYNDGRLMAHSTRRLKPGMDDQVLGSMFVAVQDFVMDSFKDDTSFTLRKLDFGSKSVLVERGENIFLAVVLHGKVSRKATGRMKAVVNEIEKEYSLELSDWDGDLDKVRGVNDIMKKLYSRAPAFPGSLK